MVGMVNAFTWSRLEWIAASHCYSLIGYQRVQNRLFQRCWPDVTGEWLPVDCDVDSLMRFISNYLDAFHRCTRKMTSSEPKACHKKTQHQQLRHTPSLLPSLVGSCRQ